ncbi:MAG: response regulator [Lachnospiraceae bacterium]|nr:response regulator [Lachnospiraceae bacterium]
MTAKQRLEKYIDIELPAEELLFHVAMLLSLIECSAMVFFTLLLRLDIRVPLLMAVGIAITVAAIYMESRISQIRQISMGYLCAMHFIIVPMASFYVPYAVYDFPVYFLTGITFTAILLKKRWAAVFIVINTVIDLGCINQMIRTVSESEIIWSEHAPYRMVLLLRIIAALFLTGTVCGVLIAYRNRLLRREVDRSTKMEQQAEQLSYAKNMFLVNVSHEIRTPLNAILGITELLLDLDVEDGVKANAFHMANSSKALLSITNELMDFSKLDDSDLSVADRPYYMGDICDELINVISVRFADRKIEFYVDIDPDIPAQLCGDVTIVRQILLSVVLGIMKSIDSGEVYLTIRNEDAVEQEIRLCIEVSSEGVFQYSYRDWLYREQTQDQDCDEEIMPLPNRLIGLMGGELHMKEEPTRRTYSFDIRQEYRVKLPLVERPLAGNPSVLFYENTVQQGDMLAGALRAIDVVFYRASDDESFLRECVEQNYTHIMIAVERYGGIKGRLTELLKPQSLILIGSNVLAYEDTLIRITFDRPVTCLNLEALITGRQNSTIRHIGYRGGFICPDAHIMVVDDNIVNLEVATSLLSRYQAQVSVAVSGRECLKMLQQEPVDFIFLDYMMPEMDGIDTLKNIRALKEPRLDQVPIVALTANAVSGAREMFLEAGFDEYISKPIERDKFEKVLRSYLPEEKIIYTHDKAEKAQ